MIIAIPRGRNLKPSVEVFKNAGMDFAETLGNSRKLIFDDDSANARAVIVRDADIPSYVESGAADMGVSGKDQLEEQDKQIYELLDLGYGACRLVLAEPAILKEKDDPSRWTNIRVATKFTNLTSKYFLSRGIHVDVIKLYGSIEIAPLVGLSERIVDLVSTGQTLKANGLVEVETIMDVSARLVVNRSALKTKTKRINGIVRDVEKFLKKKRRVKRK